MCRKFIEGMPLLVLGALIVIFVALFVWKYAILGQRQRGGATGHLPSLVGAYLMLIFYAYIYLTKTALDIFNCNTTTPPDGFTYLEVVFVRCYEPGGMHLSLLPLAIVAFAVYSFGYPATLAFYLVKHRRAIVEDQVDKEQSVRTVPHSAGHHSDAGCRDSNALQVVPGSGCCWCIHGGRFFERTASGTSRARIPTHSWFAGCCTRCTSTSGRSSGIGRSASWSASS
jgi:hypothetical protein